LHLLDWDELFCRRLESTRMIFIPILNPTGILLNWRANARGVDLMRNAPIDSDEGEDYRFFRGQQYSKNIPWFRGNPKKMEIESKALIKIVEEKLHPSRLAISVDVHSGFGSRDRLWFPYAGSSKPFRYIAEVFSLKELFDRTFPNHFYIVEPVSRSYTINGDLWDYMFDNYEAQKKPGHNFIPFTLEMGSWIWLKKNPMHFFSPLGLFHPLKPHRHKRVLRRHFTLFEFLHRSAVSGDAWLNLSADQRQHFEAMARELWYGKKT